MTHYWRAEDGLRLDTTPFVAALECATGRKAVVLAKLAAVLGSFADLPMWWENDLGHQPGHSVAHRGNHFT